MKALVLLAAILPLAACQSDTKNLDQRMDRIEKKLDQMPARGAANPMQAQGPRPGSPDPAAAISAQVAPAAPEPLCTRRRGLRLRS